MAMQFKVGVKRAEKNNAIDQYVLGLVGKASLKKNNYKGICGFPSHLSHNFWAEPFNFFMINQ
jgi:hypothetical protein